MLAPVRNPCSKAPCQLQPLVHPCPSMMGKLDREEASSIKNCPFDSNGNRGTHLDPPLTCRGATHSSLCNVFNRCTLSYSVCQSQAVCWELGGERDIFLELRGLARRQAGHRQIRSPWGRQVRTSGAPDRCISLGLEGLGRRLSGKAIYSLSASISSCKNVKIYVKMTFTQQLDGECSSSVPHQQ